LIDSTRKKLPFTLAFRLPEEANRLISCYHRRLSGFCSEFDPPETAHLTVKYLGYESPKFPEAAAEGLIPILAKICKPFLPLRVYIRGIDIFIADKERQETVVFLKILPNSDLKGLHNEIRSALGDTLEEFPHADGDNFVPHITISKHLQECYNDKIKRLIQRSRKTAKRLFKLTDLVLFTPSAIYPVFP